MADVDSLLESMTAAQLAGWMAYAELEPFGPLRDDQRAANVACVVANSIPFRGRGAKAVRPADVFATLAPPFRQQTAEEMAAYAEAVTRQMGGEVLTIKKGATDGWPTRRPGNRDRGRPRRSGRRPR